MHSWRYTGACIKKALKIFNKNQPAVTQFVHSTSQIQRNPALSRGENVCHGQEETQ